jgi:hypothetical protein
MGTERTFRAISRSVARSLYIGITTESFMARLMDGETPLESIAIGNGELAAGYSKLGYRGDCLGMLLSRNSR